MSISSIASTPVQMAPVAKSEATEKGPDRDGDSDDVGTAAASAAPKGSATAPGVGGAVDVFA